jgi:hypothetical protein
MAKTIIKGGKSEFTGHCRWCGCDFRYTVEDVLCADDSVSCPCCGRMLNHQGEHGTSTMDRFNGQRNVFDAFYGERKALP